MQKINAKAVGFILSIIMQTTNNRASVICFNTFWRMQQLHRPLLTRNGGISQVPQIWYLVELLQDRVSS